ncbi:hypothetical protein KIN20_008869 [Parelaphostrongylus tenuis]|uniref:Uncharacterized protein n=1 Tax=Parelaphostrongylus tenuis TaxID=148309 RepID=A0AAD5MRS2_PARTN|nr:hypothetical protein KIN20_008869 [Parelaphostrongylus tenuis]
MDCAIEVLAPRSQTCFDHFNFWGPPLTGTQRCAFAHAALGAIDSAIGARNLPGVAVSQ